MMKKFKLGRDILTLTIITLITVLTWVGFEVWLTATQTTITKVTQEQMSPLNPQIQTQIIESIKGNLSLSEEEMNQSLSSPSATPSTTVETEENIATGSNQTATESSQTGTESATLE